MLNEISLIKAVESESHSVMPDSLQFHGLYILQARILEWVAVPFSRIHEILQARILEQAANPFTSGSFQPRD